MAFGSLPNVNDPRGQPNDRMESFFLAETLKYLYLIQDPDQKARLTGISFFLGLLALFVHELFICFCCFFFFGGREIEEGRERTSC